MQFWERLAFHPFKCLDFDLSTCLPIRCKWRCSGGTEVDRKNNDGPNCVIRSRTAQDEAVESVGASGQLGLSHLCRLKQQVRQPFPPILFPSTELQCLLPRQHFPVPPLWPVQCCVRSFTCMCSGRRFCILEPVYCYNVHYCVHKYAVVYMCLFTEALLLCFLSTWHSSLLLQYFGCIDQ